MILKRKIPEEIFILSFPEPDEGYTLAGQSPYYDRAVAEHAARQRGGGLKVVGYHLVKTVEIH